MRVALCLSGHFRSYDRAFPSLQKAILDPYQPDVFIATWNNQGFDGVRGDMHIARTPLNTDHLSQLFSPKVMLVEPDRTWDTSKYHVKENIGLRNPQIIFGMFYGIYMANDLKSQFEKNNNFTYDVVIRSRADLLFDNVLPKFEVESCTSNKGVYFPKFGNYNGLNDQLAFGCSESMNSYSATFPHLDKFYNMGCLWHAETLSKFTATHFNIPILRSDISYGILRANGQIFRLAREARLGDIV